MFNVSEVKKYNKTLNFDKTIKLSPPPLENIVSRPWIYDPYFVQIDGPQASKLLEFRRNFSIDREKLLSNWVFAIILIMFNQL